MQRICVEMDEVMADTLAEHLRRYNEILLESSYAGGLGWRQPVGSHAVRTSATASRIP